MSAHQPIEDRNALDLLNWAVDAMGPGMPLADRAGTVDALEMIVDTVRGTVLAEFTEFVEQEIIRPRERWTGEPEWLGTEGFYLSVTRVRFIQLLESVTALGALHRAGAHRAGWAVLEQAADTLTRLWMFTETMVDVQPADEIRRSAHAWTAFADALTDVPGVPETVPHPFELAYEGTVHEAEHVSLGQAEIDAPERARDLVEAIHSGARLAAISVPAHVQIDPGSAAGTPTDWVGVDAPDVVAAQLQLAVELMRSAAVSVYEALVVSREGRTN